MKLISDEYRKQNELLHKSRTKYGQRGHRHIPVITEIIEDHDCATVLDYGCGTGELVKKAPFEVNSYDPAISRYAQLPKPADLVVCTDVLEHIEPELLDNVLKHLKDLTLKVGYFVIATRPDTSKSLPDGSNPHKIIQKPHWWKSVLSNYFTVYQFRAKIGECECIVLKR